MTKTSQLFLLTLLACALGASYVYQRGQARQAALLARFKVLDADLMADNQQAARAANATVRSIRRTTYLNHQQADDRAVLGYSEQILARTQSLADTLRTLREQLHFFNSSLVSPTPRGARLPVTVQRQRVLGAALATHLVRYARFIQQFIDSADFGDSLLARELVWTTRQTRPAVVTAAALAGLETYVQQAGTQALQHEAEKVGTKCFFCWRLAVRAVPASTTVAPGALYQARLFLEETPAGDYGPLTMTANGQALPVQREAGGLVELAVPPRQPGQPDTVRASWRGVIRAHSYPVDTTWQVEVPYYIVQHPAL